MGMHAKPNELDQLVHTLLTWIMIACIVISAAEIAAPQSLLLALLRGMLVFFQGTWFWHVGAIMFKGEGFLVSLFCCFTGSSAWRSLYLLRRDGASRHAGLLPGHMVLACGRHHVQG